MPVGSWTLVGMRFDEGAWAAMVDRAPAVSVGLWPPWGSTHLSLCCSPEQSEQIPVQV